VTRLGLVKDCKSADAHESLHLELTILESLVSGTQSVTEVLSEDPSDIGVGSFLHSVGGVFSLYDSKLKVSPVANPEEQLRTKGLSGRQ
jgi:hypothetical protein